MYILVVESTSCIRGSIYFHFGGLINHANLDVLFSIYLDRSTAYSSGLQELSSLRIYNPIIIPSSWTAHIDSLKLTAARPEKKDGAWKRILFVGEKGSHISNSIDN